MSIDEAKDHFMALCSEWADLLITEGATHVERGGPRWQFVDSFEEWIPQLVHGTMPDVQMKVWKGGYQLMLDAYDIHLSQTKLR